MERVVIINDFAQVRGGASSQAVKLAHGMARRGLDVHFFSGAEAPKAQGNGVSHHALGQKKLMERSPWTALVQGLHNAAAAHRLTQLIQKIDSPDTIYHVHGWGQVLSPSIFAPLTKVADRVVLHAHDLSMACPNIVYFNFQTGKTCDQVPMSLGCLASDCDKRSRGQKIWRYARHGIYRGRARDLRRTRPVIAVHEAMEPFLRKGGVGGEIIAVRNTADALLPTPVQAEKNKNIIYLGQILSFKGVFDLAEAANQSGVRTVVIGDGPDMAEMQRICPAADYKGWKSRDELGALLAKARALVVPTRGVEPFGVVVVEAARSGIPVIVSDGLLLARDVERLGFGLTYPAGDVEALATTLERVAADDRLVAQLSRSAVEHGASLSPSEDEWLDRIQAVYKRILSRARIPASLQEAVT